MNTPNWQYRYTSAAAARDHERGTDGGGASGYIYEGGDIRMRVLAFAPHHRDPAEDVERENILRLMSLAPRLLDSLKKLLPMWESGIDEPWVKEAQELVAEAEGRS